MERTPYGDSMQRLRLALELLDVFRSRVAALPEGRTSADDAITAAAAALASPMSKPKPQTVARHSASAADPDPDFIPAATFDTAKAGFSFKTGPQGTGYYRLRTSDALVGRSGSKLASRHAHTSSGADSGPVLLQSASSQSPGTGSSGGPYSELTRSTGFSPRGVGSLPVKFDQRVVTSDSEMSGHNSPTSQRATQRSRSAERMTVQRQTAADEWASVESNEPQPRDQAASTSRQLPLPQNTMSRMSDHVADEASFDTEEDDDDDSDSSPSESATSRSSNPGGAGGLGLGTSGSSGGPYSALTRSLGASPSGEGGTLAGKPFQEKLSSDSDGLSSRDSPPKRPRDMPAHYPVHYDSSDDGEIEFG